MEVSPWQPLKQYSKIDASVLLANNPAGIEDSLRQSKKQYPKLVAPVLFLNNSAGMDVSLEHDLKKFSKLVAPMLGKGVRTAVSRFSPVVSRLNVICGNCICEELGWSE